MEFSFNMTEEEKLQWEEYHETVVLVWRTQFKNGFVSGMVNGFNAQNFVGTGKEYYKTLEEFNGSDDKGKVIGSFSYTIEEWDEMHKPKEVDPIAEKERLKRIAELEARFEAEYQAKKLRNTKTRNTKRD